MRIKNWRLLDKCHWENNVTNEELHIDISWGKTYVIIIENKKRKEHNQLDNAVTTMIEAKAIAIRYMRTGGI